jgi:hypothetical protein
VKGSSAGGASDIKAAADAIGQIIASNLGTPKKICSEIVPFLRSNPDSAAELIALAQATPDLLEPLCGCLSKSQRVLKASDFAAAKIVAKAVAESSPAFQACYAVASSAENQDGHGSQVVPSGHDAESYASREGSYSPGIGSGAIGFSGGLVSPN